MIVSKPGQPRDIGVTIDLSRVAVFGGDDDDFNNWGKSVQQYVVNLLNAESKLVNGLDTFNSVVVVTDMMLNNTDTYVYKPELEIGKSDDKFAVTVGYRELNDQEKARLIKAMYRQIRKMHVRGQTDTAGKNCVTESGLELDLSKLNPEGKDA